MSTRKWVIIGTSNTVKRIVELCAYAGIEADGYPLVVARENPDIREELRRLGYVDTCVFTSRRAVELVYQNSSEDFKSNIRRCAVYTIGPSTTRRVHELFNAESTHPNVDYSSTGLVKLLTGRILGRTALFSSVKRSEILVDALRMYSQVLYEPKLYDLGVDSQVASRFIESLENSYIRGLVFTCSTAATIMGGTSVDSSIRIVAMGPRTLATLSALGYNSLIPTHSTVEGVVKLIVELEGSNVSEHLGRK